MLKLFLLNKNFSGHYMLKLLKLLYIYIIKVLSINALQMYLKSQN